MTVRVAFLTADLDVGGIQSMVESLGRGLDRRRFEPSFVCFDRKGAIADRLARDGYEVRFVERRPGLDTRLPRALRAAFSELRADVVHAHNRTALFYAVFARALRGSPRLVYTEHDRSFPEALKVRALHAVLARRLDAVVAVCGAVRDAIVATERFPAARTHVVVNGVADPGVTFRDPAARRSVREEFGVSDDRKLVLAVGHLTPVKDHETLLSAFARIPRELGAFLVVAGDGPLRAALEARRSALGIERDVAFPGYRADVPRLLAGCDVLAMSSRSEGLSIALVEAIARGVPVVATRVGGNDEIVSDRENGLLVPAGDPDALGSALATLLADPALGAAFSRAGRARYERRFRLEAMVDAYSRIYDDVIARTR